MISAAAGPAAILIFAHFDDLLKMGLLDGLNGEALAALEHEHAIKLLIGFQFFERDKMLKLLDELDIYAEPDGSLFLGTAVARHTRHSRRPGRLCAGVVEKHLVPLLQPVTKEVPGLVITDAVPERFFIFLQRIDRIYGRFGFEEPVVHGWTFSNKGLLAMSPGEVTSAAPV